MYNIMFTITKTKILVISHIIVNHINIKIYIKKTY